jgi:hypothetical protein
MCRKSCPDYASFETNVAEEPHRKSYWLILAEYLAPMLVVGRSGVGEVLQKLDKRA